MTSTAEGRAEAIRRQAEQSVAERWLCGELPGSPQPALRKVRNVVRDLSDYEPEEGEQGGR